MPDQQTRSLKILARIQAMVSGLIAVGIFAIYGFKPALLNDTSISLAAAILGTLGVVYFLTLHLVLARSRMALSTLILTIITASNIILIIASTGGLDSPFYSLWLLAIVVAGIFGTAETLSVLGLTVAYYIYVLVGQGLHSPYTKDHLIQLGITLIAGALAEWVHGRNRQASMAGSKLETLSGELSAEQLKAEAVMSSIGEGVMVIDGSRRIQFFNKAAQDLTGWDGSSAQNIDYNLVLQLKAANDQPLAKENDPFAASWEKQETIVRNNLVMTTRADRKVQLSLSVSPILDNNKHPNGAIALFRDISKEKEVERQKDEFVSTASHEMRTPVAAIEGYISLAMNPNVASIDDRAKKYLEKAHETIAHLGELFRDLLSVTKAEEGMLGAKIEPINMAKLMQDVTEDLQSIATKKNLALVYQIGPQSGKAIAPLFYIAANAERMREVVMNLIDNGLKFTAAGGVKVTIEGNDKEVTVSISDSGVGISTEDMPHLFQKFYRIDNSATRTIGGTGLGLYLCRQVIELYNGRIWVESKPGEGSTFKFKLPRLSQSEVDRMLAEATAPPADNAEPAAAEPGAVVQPTSPAANSGSAGPMAAAIPSPVPTERSTKSSSGRTVQ
jgi:PAS domain S-box-containing protein